MPSAPTPSPIGEELILEQPGGTFRLPKLPARAAGEYVLEIQNEGGSVRSAPFSVEINPGPRLTLIHSSDGRIRLQLDHAPTGRAFLLERSEDLVTWQAVGEGHVEKESLILDPKDAFEHLSSYYRMRFPQ